jgi:transposase-like protein
MSAVAATYEVHPSMILKWRKQLFEGALQTFETQRPDITEKANERKSKGLEAKLLEKDNVIAELAQEVLQLKKKYPGLK